MTAFAIKMEDRAQSVSSSMPCPWRDHCNNHAVIKDKHTVIADTALRFPPEEDEVLIQVAFDSERAPEDTDDDDNSHSPLRQTAQVAFPSASASAKDAQVSHNA